MIAVVLAEGLAMLGYRDMAELEVCCKQAPGTGRATLVEGLRVRGYELAENQAANESPTVEVSHVTTGGAGEAASAAASPVGEEAPVSSSTTPPPFVDNQAKGRDKKGRFQGKGGK